MSAYRYIGDGRGFVGIPARDLTADEVEAIGEDTIIATGLYEKVVEEPAERPQPRRARKPAEGDEA